MFGSAFLVKPKPGQKDKLLALFSEDMQGSQPKGFVCSYTLEKANGDIWVLAVFDDEKTYRDNASSPEQDKNYRRMRELLQADPEWNDGTITEYKTYKR